MSDDREKYTTISFWHIKQTNFLQHINKNMDKQQRFEENDKTEIKSEREESRGGMK